MNCAACGNTVNADARFCSSCGQAVASAYVPPATTPLVRPQFGRVIAGVCAGFAQHYGWDVVLVRLALVAAVLCCGLPLVVYFVAWVVMPEGPFFVTQPDAQPAAPSGSQTV
jgi:phage shock protein C